MRQCFSEVMWELRIFCMQVPDPALGELCISSSFLCLRKPTSTQEGLWRSHLVGSGGLGGGETLKSVRFSKTEVGNLWSKTWKTFWNDSVNHVCSDSCDNYINALLMQQYPGNTLMRQNITTTCLICCRSFVCHQNSSDLPRHGICETSEGALWYLALRH